MVSFTVVAAVIFIFLGVFINFLPTIVYYAEVYPHIPLDKVAPGAYFTYVVGNAVFPLKFANGSQALLSMTNGTLNVTMLSNGTYRVALEGTIQYFGPKGVSEIPVKSDFVLNSSNPFIKMLFVNKKDSVAVIGNKTIRLQIDPREYTFHTFGGLNPYTADFSEGQGDFISYILFSGGELVMSNLLLNAPRPNDTLFRALPIFYNLLQNVDAIKRLTASTIPMFNISLLSIGPYTSNVKTVNNVTGEITWDFFVTFFPINIVLISIGAIILVIKIRGKLR